MLLLSLTPPFSLFSFSPFFSSSSFCSLSLSWAGGMPLPPFVGISPLGPNGGGGDQEFFLDRRKFKRKGKRRQQHHGYHTHQHTTTQKKQSQTIDNRQQTMCEDVHRDRQASYLQSAAGVSVKIRLSLTHCGADWLRLSMPLLQHQILSLCIADRVRSIRLHDRSCH